MHIHQSEAVESNRQYAREQVPTVYVHDDGEHDTPPVFFEVPSALFDSLYAIDPNQTFVTLLRTVLAFYLSGE